MIEPGELHKHFAVREIKTGRTLRVSAGDTRYAITGTGLRDYRPDPDGEHFLVDSIVPTHPWKRPIRLDEV